MGDNMHVYVAKLDDRFCCCLAECPNFLYWNSLVVSRIFLLGNELALDTSVAFVHSLVPDRQNCTETDR